MATTVRAQEPAPPAQGALTMDDFRGLCLVWNRTTMAEAYQQVGKTNPAWDKPAIALLELLADQFSDPRRVLPTDELLAAADAAAATSCDDPLVLYCIGVVHDIGGDPETAETYVRRAVEGYRTSGYPKCRTWGAAERLATLCEALGGDKEDEAESWRDLAVEWLAAGVGEPVVSGDFVRVVLSQVDSLLNGDLWMRARQVAEAVAANANADPWLADMIEGECHIGLAWDARGDGLADTVTEEGWKGFFEHLQLARENLTAAYALHPDFPEAAAKMITVASAGHFEDELPAQEWFHRAIAAQFDYPAAYSDYIHFARPRWGGSTNEMDRFAIECLDTGRFDTDVPHYYITTERIIADEEGITDIWGRRETAIREDRLYEGLLNEPLHEAEYPRLRTEWAAVAWRGGRPEVARQLFDELGDDADPDTFVHWTYTSLAWARGETYALTGPSADEVQRAQQLYAERQLPEALAAFEALQGTTADPFAAAYLRDRVVALQAEIAFYGGEWVDMLPGPDFAGWERFSDVWTVADDGSVCLSPDADYTPLILAARLEGDYELEGEVQLPPAGTDANATICMYYRRGATPGWLNLGLDPETGEVLFGYERKDVPFGTTVTFQVQVWQGRANVRVDGEEVFAGAPAVVENPWRIPLEFALQGRNLGGEGSVVRYRRLRVHRLAGPPAGL